MHIRVFNKIKESFRIEFWQLGPHPYEHNTDTDARIRTLTKRIFVQNTLYTHTMKFVDCWINKSRCIICMYIYIYGWSVCRNVRLSVCVCAGVRVYVCVSVCGFREELCVGVESALPLLRRSYWTLLKELRVEVLHSVGM